jgi:hypothetical protein
MCPPLHPTIPTPIAWRALEPAIARHIMNVVDAPWWIAGGWAIDLFVGTRTRAHKDLDLAPSARAKPLSAGMTHRDKSRTHLISRPSGAVPYCRIEPARVTGRRQVE